MLALLILTLMPKDEERASNLITSGVLRGQEMARALVLLILQKADRQRRKCANVCASSHPDVDKGVLVELGYRLGGVIGNKELMRELGLNLAGLPPINYQDEFLPKPFAAEGLVLKSNIERSLELLHVWDRSYMIVWDDTAFAASQEVLKCPDPFIVGGPWPTHHKIPVEQDVPDVPVLATQALSIVVKRTDSNQHLWQVCLLPRTAKSGSQHDMLDLIGTVLQMSTEAHHGLPPLSIACDAHCSHGLILQTVTGLLSPPDSPFWRGCALPTSYSLGTLGLRWAVSFQSF